MHANTEKAKIFSRVSTSLHFKKWSECLGTKTTNYLITGRMILSIKIFIGRWRGAIFLACETRIKFSSLP